MSQDFKFSAKLDDKVSSSLGKIEGKLRSVQSALSGFVDKFKSSGDELSSSSQSSVHKTKSTLSSLDDALRNSSEQFENLGKSAATSSKKISTAIQDSLYGKGAEERLNELDEGLGKLGNTFSGMASRQKAVSGKARTLASTTKDSINRKVIPAFQHLHSTLDDYPDTLREINKLESERYDILEKQPELLAKVATSMGNLGKKVKDIQFSMSDALAVVTTGYMGNVGLQVQDQQRDFAKSGGIEGVTDLVETLRKTTALAQAPMEEVGPIIQTMRELRSVAQEAMPEVASGLFDLSKAIGMTGSELVHFQDKMTRVQGLNQNQFTQLTDSIQGIAHNSSATAEELIAVVQNLGPEILKLSQEGRLAYAKSAIAAAAAAKDAGMDTGTAEGLMDRLRTDTDAYIRIGAMLKSTGHGNIDELLQGDPQAFMAAVHGSTKQTFSHMIEGKQNISNMPILGQQFTSLTAGAIPIDFAMREFKKTGAGTGDTLGGESYKLTDHAGTGKEVFGMVRSTTTEQLEQLRGTTQSAAITSGEKLIRATGTVIGKIEEMAVKGASFFDKMDKKMGGGLSTGLAAGVGAKAVWGIGDAISGGRLSGMVGGESGDGGKGMLKKAALMATAIFVGSRLMKDKEVTKKTVAEVKTQEQAAATPKERYKEVVKVKDKLQEQVTPEKLGNKGSLRELIGDTKNLQKAVEDQKIPMKKFAKTHREIKPGITKEGLPAKFSPEAVTGESTLAGIKTDFKPLVSGVKKSFEILGKGVQDTVGEFFDGSKKRTKDLKDRAKKEIAHFFKPVTDGFKNAFKSLKKIMSDIASSVKETYKSIEEGVNKAFESVKNSLVKSYEAAKSKINDIAGKIKDFFSPITDSILSAYNIAKDKIAGIIGVVRDTAGAVAGKIGDVVGGVKNKIGEVVAPVIETAGKIKDFAVGVAAPAISGIRETAGALKDRFFKGATPEEETTKDGVVSVGKTFAPGAETTSGGGTFRSGDSHFRSMGESFAPSGGKAPVMDGSRFKSIGDYEVADAAPLERGQRARLTPSKKKTIESVVPYKANVEKTRSIQESRQDKGSQLAQKQLSIQEQMLAQLVTIAQNCKAPAPKADNASSEATNARSLTPGEKQSFKISAWSSGRSSYGSASAGGKA